MLDQIADNIYESRERIFQSRNEQQGMVGDILGQAAGDSNEANGEDAKTRMIAFEENANAHVDLMNKQLKDRMN